MRRLALVCALILAIAVMPAAMAPAHAAAPRAPMTTPALAHPDAPSGAATRPKVIFYPTRPAALARHHQTIPAVWGTGPLNYYGGSVLHTPTSYDIFWGAGWDDGSSDAQSAAQIVLNYFNDVGGTAFERILTQYFDGARNVANTHTLAAHWLDPASPPTATACGGHPTIQDDAIQREVAHAIAANGWPSDATNAVYYVYTPPGDYIEAEGDCSFTGGGAFCAYHSATDSPTITSAALAYAAMPYPNLGACPSLQSPNGNAAGDSLVNLTSHEQFEAITDPISDGPGVPYGLTAWTDDANYEIGDKCAWIFPNRDNGDTVLGAHTYHVQLEYSNADGACVNSYTPASTPHLSAQPAGGISLDVPINTNATSPPITLDNPTAGTVDWSAGALPGWVSPHPTHGSLAAGYATRLTLSFATASATPQTFAATLTFSGNADNTPLAIPITVTVEPPPPNDDIASPTAITSLPYITSENVAWATIASDDPTACGTQGSRSVWFQFQAAEPLGLRINATGSGSPAVVMVWTGTRGQLALVSCRAERIDAFTTAAATDYLIEVAAVPGATSSGGYVPLNLAITLGPVVTATGGVYRPSDHTFYLRNSNTTGYADITATFGAADDMPLTGDWNGDGVATIGVYRPSDHTFYLRNSNTSGLADTTVVFGAAGDIPLVGAWGCLTCPATVGVYRPSDHTFYLRFSNTTGPAQYALRFGRTGDVPIAGNWDGSGISVGVYRPATGTFYLAHLARGGPVTVVRFGPPGGTPLAGDWTNKGYDSIGVASGGAFMLRDSNTSGPADIRFWLGRATDVPLAGAWTAQTG